MAFDPENSKHISQLDESIKYADDKLNKFREQMVQHVKQLAGSQYGEEACDDNTPIPLMSLAHRIYRRFIGTREPRAVVATRFRELLPQAATLELALNHQLEKMNLGEALTNAEASAVSHGDHGSRCRRRWRDVRRRHSVRGPHPSTCVVEQPEKCDGAGIVSACLSKRQRTIPVRPEGSQKELEVYDEEG